MKYKKTTHWTNKRNQEGLLFFAQVLDEALFDFTLDTYKPKALNIRLLCIEAVQTIDEIKNGLIKKPNLKSIIEELLFSLNSDYATKAILGNRFDNIVSRIKSTENNLIELKGIILHIYHHFDERKYLDYLINCLVDLVPKNKEKEHIYSLTKIYLTELINYGYLPGHIYYQVNQYFFNLSKPVKEVSPKEFFEIFNFEKHKYKVIFRADGVFNEFTSISKILNFSIKKEYPINGLTGQNKNFIEDKTKKEVFIVFENIESTDELSARHEAEIPLESIANMFSFYHHKEKPQIANKALVINNQNNISLLLDKPIKSIIKKEDIKPKDAVNNVINIFEKLNLPLETILRLTKAFDLHSIALETDEIENKLLNLWTAIETLIPKDLDSGQDRIIQIINGLMPFQCVNYLDKILQQVSRDFYYYNPKLTSSILKTVVTKQTESRWYKLAAIIATKENEKIRTNIYGNLDDFPLLRWRIFTINKYFENGKSLKKLIENHVKRVEWQIRRIYRVRNLIVHSGSMPSYTNILVENLHNYYDNMVNYIIDSASENKNIRSIKEGAISCDIDLNVLLDSFDKIGEKEINLENYKMIV